MNDVTPKDWADELRSTDKIQGHGYLNNNQGKYCCLGVLAEMLDPERQNWQGDMTHLPESMIPVWLSRDASTTAINMNDEVKPSSFEEIADWIDERWKVKR